jgi:hypothetical protein
MRMYLPAVLPAARACSLVAKRFARRMSGLIRRFPLLPELEPLDDCTFGAPRS